MQDTFVVAPFVLLTAFMFILMSAIVFTNLLTYMILLVDRNAEMTWQKISCINTFHSYYEYALISVTFGFAR